MGVRKFQLEAGVVVLGLCVLLSGCQTVKKATGSYEAYMQADPERVVSAARASMEELGLIGVVAQSTKLDGELSARTAQDKTVTVSVQREGEDVSRMTVRVGTFGDKAMSQTIIRKTMDRLE
ncbi:MAG: DUF3568 family protein [Phycisphaerae bacterium]|nr:DUF3568 family protein [Phycisphaerae bacterium]